MRILVTGSKGQVGSQLIDIINSGSSEIGEIPQAVRNAEVIGKSSRELDITDAVKVSTFIKELKPDVVINSAAYTNVDGCETDESRAFMVNALGPRNLAMACEEISAKFLHISTDYVFSGVSTRPYREYDLPSPQSVYGKTKNMGENYVREFSSRYFIVRPSWVYGYHGKNFVYTVMKTANEKGTLKVVNDQIGTPTNAEDLVHHILKLIVTDDYGIYHCAGKGECSWYEFAGKIVQLAGIPCTITPCTSEEYPSPTKRPAYSSLDNMMLRCTVGDEMRNWEDALKNFIENAADFLR
ncbi:MAG: dTDP-4-dehydrorhamnose reductase [Bacillota bacterium]|nr:dTDP-4-dehydrorhamnose reductase [Bacillota bacterium]